MCNPTADVTLSVDEFWSNFKVSFTAVAHKHAPLLEKRVRGIACPWLTGEIKRGIRQRDYHLRKAKRSNATEDWSVYRFL